MLAALVVSSQVLAAGQAPEPAETSAQHEARMTWWREARFGIFVTWGLYALPAGVWQDGRVQPNRYGEWIMSHLNIPFSEYEPLAKQWHPDKWQAEKLVRLAKRAGAKYLTFTTKWHDGFCMWDTAQTDWSVARAMPRKRDPFKDLAAAAHRHGLKLMPYYSIMDWHQPDYEPRSKLNDTARGKPDMDNYVRFMKAQLAELEQKYGPLAGFWFDGNWEPTWTEGRGRDLEAFCRQLVPGAVLNNRVGKAKDGGQGIVSGDFSTPELEIPADGLPGRDWETCMTMNNTWGYRRDDVQWKTPAEVIRMLIDCASKGGNFLLNVGPKADGSIPQPSLDILEALANWMAVNSQSIYGTSASPFPAKFDWGRVTAKGDLLYLHLFAWPKDSVIELPAVCDEAPAAWLLADKSRKPLKVEQTAQGLRVCVPADLTLDLAATVVAVKGRATVRR
jgi:alpha-L-fucosidase